MKTIKINLIKSILAGIAISVAGVAYLSVDNYVVGALLFSVGLLSIYLFDWNLYTGKCCYVALEPKKYFLVTVIAFVGNLIGAILIGYLIRFSGLSIYQKAVQSVEYKLEHNYLQYLILAFFCGVMMSIAVLGYTKQKDSFGKSVIVILSIMVFILAKFEHVIANMFYISLANMWNLDTIVFVIICAIGNLIGCSIIPILNTKSNCLKTS